MARKSKPETLKKSQVKVEMLDPMNPVMGEAVENSLRKSVLNMLNGGSTGLTRLAFEQDPTENLTYASIYKPKVRLIPDDLLKRIAIQDDLVASIVGARADHISAFGHERSDRFSSGYILEPRPGVLEASLTQEQRTGIMDRIDRLAKLLSTCGTTKGWDDEEQMNLAQFLAMTCRDSIVVGRFAVEVIWVENPNTGQQEFHSFRPVDAATIYKAVPQTTAADSVRRDALALLEDLKGEKLEPEKFVSDEYKWVQVVHGTPRQAFTGREMLVENVFPVTDIDLGGYPLTPLDTVITAVTTHLSIGAHNKLYFQTGRAAKGMLVLKSEDVDINVIKNIRQQFNASINNVTNSWRMPVFGIGEKDEITWQPIDQGGSRDMEFQYLSDQNARVILSAFRMSPEELPGYGHLSRGTNNQALAEGNNEYKLTAARDVGIRPLLAKFQDFLNNRILPLIDPEMAKVCWIRLAGLDADTPEKEAIRIEQDANLHLTFNEILERVEKDPIPKIMGGEIPLNPSFGQICDNHMTVGEFEEYFMGRKGAAKDPSLQYRRDPLWFQFQQLQMQAQQMQQQAQMQQMQAQQQAQQPQQGQPPQQKSEGDGDLTSALDQLIQSQGLSKAEAQLSPSSRKLVAQHKQAVDALMSRFEAESKESLEKVMWVASSAARRVKR